jgi:hypothetical protein
VSRWDHPDGFNCVNPYMTRQPVDYRAEDLPVGAAIYRDYKGARHWVYVVPPAPANTKGYWRYVYKDKRYRTLTAIVCVIAPHLKCRSGNDFFRLRRRRS